MLRKFDVRHMAWQLRQIADRLDRMDTELAFEARKVAIGLDCLMTDHIGAWWLAKPENKLLGKT